MRYRPPFILMLLWVCCACAPAQAQVRGVAHWERLADMPVGVFNAAASLTEPYAVITGGITQTGLLTNLVQVFDMSVQSWTASLRAPIALCHHAQVTLPDGRILVAGGQTGALFNQITATQKVFLIDPRLNLITEQRDLPEPAAQPTADLLPDGRAIVIGGRSASIFDSLTETWVETIALCQPRQAHASTVLSDGRVLVVGGLGRASLELIDPVNRTNRLLAARLPFPMDDLKIVSLPNQRAWVLGGQRSYGGDTTDRTWVVDLSNPHQARLEEGPRLGMSAGIADACVAQIGQWVVLAGGESQRAGQDTELDCTRLLNTQTLTVQPMPVLVQPSDDAVAIVTERSMILFGGFALRPGGLIPVVSRVSQRLDLPHGFGGLPEGGLLK